MGKRAGGPLVAAAPEVALPAHGGTGRGVVVVVVLLLRRRMGARAGGRSAAGQIALEEAVALLVEVGLQQKLGGKGALTGTALQLGLDVVLPGHVTGKRHDDDDGWICLVLSLSLRMCE